MEDICVVCGMEDVSDLGTQVCAKCLMSINKPKTTGNELIYNSENIDHFHLDDRINLRD